MEILLDVQEELVYYLYKENHLKDCMCKKDCQMKNKKFYGDVFKKKSQKIDFVFSLEKLQNKCCICQLEPVKQFTLSYIQSLSFGKTYDLIFITLNRMAVTEKLFNALFMLKKEPVVSEKQNVYTLIIHTNSSNLGSLQTIQPLLLSLFTQKLLYRKMISTNLILNSLDGSCIYRIPLEAKGNLLFINELITEVNNENCQHPLTISGECLNDIYEQLLNGENVVTTEREIAINLKDYVDSRPQNSVFIEHFLKDFMKITIKDDSNYTDSFVKAAEVSSLLKSKQNIIHFTSTKNAYCTKKLMVLARLISMEDSSTNQKICLFNEDVVTSDKSTDQSIIIFSDLLRIQKLKLWKTYKMKYGENITGQSWEDVINNVALSSLKFDLLSVSTKSKIRINKETDGIHLSSRNSLFVLYNYARLRTIINTFEENVKEGIYPHLPNVDNIAFEHLISDSEWNIVLRYILRHGSLIEDMFEEVLNNKIDVGISTNVICNFLEHLARDLSSYYYQTKILLDPRPHLFPAVHARMYLIFAIEKLMSDCFELLTITPPDSM